MFAYLFFIPKEDSNTLVYIFIQKLKELLGNPDYGKLECFEMQNCKECGTMKGSGGFQETSMREGFFSNRKEKFNYEK